MQQELLGYLAYAEDKLLLDGMPVEEGQILVVQWEKGTFVGRAQLHPKGGWQLNCEEFIGHTYLNIPFQAKYLPEMTVRLGKDSK